MGKPKSAAPTAPARPVFSPAARAETLRNMSLHMDDWFNAANDLGVMGKDKRKSAKFDPTEILDPQSALELYRGDALAARIVETPADHLVREGWDVLIEDDGEGDAEDVDKALTDLDTAETVHEAICLARATGGSCILLGADDGQKDLTKPLDLKRVRSFDWMNVLSRLELQPTEWYADPNQKGYGRPKVYRILQAAVAPGQPLRGQLPRTFKSVGDVYVHESRMIRFDGVRVTRLQALAQSGWNDSVLSRCHPVLRDYGLSWAVAGTLLQEFGQAVLKVEGLFELLNQGPQGDAAVVRRAAAARIARSIANLMLIDSKEEFEHKSIPLSGFPEMLREFAYRLASVADMPVSLLMGQAPAGLNATGDSDIRWFYDRISALQERVLRSRSNRITELVMAAKDGPTKGKVPKNWSVRFASLWQPSPVEQADIRLKQAQTDQIYINTQVITPEEAATSRFGGADYSTDTIIDLENRPAVAQPVDPAAAPGAAAGAPRPRTPAGARAPAAGLGSRPSPDPKPAGGSTP
jgi:phage-related protein (TIGR01555 family)